MPRAILSVCLTFWLLAPAGAQTQQEGQMRLYIQQLEEQVRQLTGENERLAYEVNQLRAQLGLPPVAQGQGAMPPGQDVVTGQNMQPGAAPDAVGSVAANDPLNAPDGAGMGAQGAGAPVDLSTLASGMGEQMLAPGASVPAQPAPGTDTAMIAPGAQAPAPTTALSGSARDEYDLAYGYILTGDYGLAEESFRTWLAAFPGDPQASDAEFWLGESHLQQGEYRDAANAFLAVYKTAPDSTKGPDALLKLGVSLSALGEQSAACATFSELGRRYPRASESVMNRVRDEKTRAGCSG